MLPIILVRTPGPVFWKGITIICMRFRRSIVPLIVRSSVRAHEGRRQQGNQACRRSVVENRFGIGGEEYEDHANLQ